jgi:uncharacterized protein
MTQLASPTHSAVFSGLSLLLLTGLAVNVSLSRLRHKVFLGDGEIKALQVAIRTHSNALEHLVPLLLLLILYELLGGSKTIVDGLGLGILVWRTAHAVGYLGRLGSVQQFGSYGTYLMELVLPALVIAKGLS